MIDTSFLGLLDRFNLIIKKRVTSNYKGTRRSIGAGRGLTIRDRRAYAPGDDFRAIDWKVYARSDNLYIKRYEEERNMTTHIVVDNSASMNFGKKVKKFEYASMVGVGFAYLVMRENEKFQFSTFSETLQTFQPRRGMSHIASMVDYLNEQKPKGKSNFGELMVKYKQMIHTKALLIIVSDFLFDLEQIKRGLHALANNELRVIMVLDKVEKDLSLSGEYKLHDSESSTMMRTSISPRLKEKYKGALDEHIEEIAKTCSKVSADFHLVTTNTPIFDTFYKLLRGI